MGLRLTHMNNVVVISPQQGTVKYVQHVTSFTQLTARRKSWSYLCKCVYGKK